MKFTSFENKTYSFDKITKEYVGETIGVVDPILTKKNGKPTYSCTTSSTFQKPPDVKENEIQIYDFKTDSWIIKKDFRGKEYYLSNGTKIVITEIDKTFPEDAILEPPLEDLKTPEYVNNKWIETSLIYKNFNVETKEDVDRVTSSLIKSLDEEKCKTEKLLAGNNECKIWDEFVEKRNNLIEEGKEFKKTNNLI